jgi:membrane glycosyltransferase
MGGRLPLHSQQERRTQMQLIITFMAVVAGLIFSIAVALLVEEMIFGQVFRIFFTPQSVEQSVRVKATNALSR